MSGCQSSYRSCIVLRCQRWRTYSETTHDTYVYRTSLPMVIAHSYTEDTWRGMDNITLSWRRYCIRFFEADVHILCDRFTVLYFGIACCFIIDNDGWVHFYINNNEWVSVLTLKLDECRVGRRVARGIRVRFNDSGERDRAITNPSRNSMYVWTHFKRVRVQRAASTNPMRARAEVKAYLLIHNKFTFLCNQAKGDGRIKCGPLRSKAPSFFEWRIKHVLYVSGIRSIY